MELVLSRMIVASKCGVRCFNGETGVTNSAQHISEYIEGTISRLGFPPDLYYLHRIDPSTPLEESIPALDALRKEGKCRYIGLSECSAMTLRKANESTSPSCLSINFPVIVFPDEMEWWQV
jgi:aryl-alcohol dehydrogenase-like predicted oxidoreductase